MSSFKSFFVEKVKIKKFYNYERSTFGKENFLLKIS